jgi:hypothetical protein
MLDVVAELFGTPFPFQLPQFKPDPALEFFHNDVVLYHEMDANMYALPKAGGSTPTIESEVL